MFCFDFMVVQKESNITIEPLRFLFYCILLFLVVFTIVKMSNAKSKLHHSMNTYVFGYTTCSNLYICKKDVFGLYLIRQHI